MENKTSKYFQYAIGEIVLVVIGILIALQINNWNVKRLNGIEEERALKDLLEEVDEAITSREQIISNCETLSDNLGNVLNKFFSSNEPILTENECRSIFRSHQIIYNVTDLSVVEELITSGKISIISNIELRKLMIGIRNVFKVNSEALKTLDYKILVDDYPNLIVRTWNLEQQNSTFECIGPEMVNNKYFLAHLQSNHGRLNAPISRAKQELAYLHKMKTIINKNN